MPSVTFTKQAAPYGFRDHNHPLTERVLYRREMCVHLQATVKCELSAWRIYPSTNACAQILRLRAESMSTLQPRTELKSTTSVTRTRLYSCPLHPRRLSRFSSIAGWCRGHSPLSRRICRKWSTSVGLDPGSTRACLRYDGS